MRKLIYILLICISTPLIMTAQEAANRIRLNQIGFYPDAPKIAVITDYNNSEFLIKSATSGEIVFKSKLSSPHKSEFSPKVTRIADFSVVTKPGIYKLNLPGQGDSYTFEIKPKIFCNLTKLLLKVFIFRECQPHCFLSTQANGAVQPDTPIIR